MFLIRSAFWLVIGFLLVAPRGTDFGAVKDQALAAGQQIIVGQMASAVMPNLMSNTPSVDLPMQDSPKSPVPFPRPRPDWMG
jgi:hypothetical protein